MAYRRAPEHSCAEPLQLCLQASNVQYNRIIFSSRRHHKSLEHSVECYTPLRLPRNNRLKDNLFQHPVCSAFPTDSLHYAIFSLVPHMPSIIPFIQEQYSACFTPPLASFNTNSSCSLLYFLYCLAEGNAYCLVSPLVLSPQLLCLAISVTTEYNHRIIQ